MVGSGLRKSFRDQKRILFVSLLCLIGFLFVAFLKSGFTAVDSNVNSWSGSVHTGLFTFVAEIISFGFGTAVLLVSSLLVAAYLFYNGYRWNAFLLVGAMGGIAVIVAVVKALVHSVRPLDGVIQESGFSFPSGHVTSTVVFFGLLTFFVWPRWKGSLARTFSVVFYVVLEFLVGFSRVYLNVHWLSDVLGGYLLGVFWFGFVVFLFRFSENDSSFEG